MITKKILIVEDDVFIRDIYQKTLIKVGYTIETAEDGESAVQKATTNHYDLILLDIMLPKVSGIDVLKKIRASAPPCNATPVILITNLTDENVVKDALAYGVNGYLLKAEVSPETMIKEVNTFFEKQQTTS